MRLFVKKMASFVPVTIPGDGDCLFAAVAVGVEGFPQGQGKGVQYRHLAAQYWKDLASKPVHQWSAREKELVEHVVMSTIDEDFRGQMMHNRWSPNRAYNVAVVINGLTNARDPRQFLVSYARLMGDPRFKLYGGPPEIASLSEMLGRPIQVFLKRNNAFVPQSAAYIPQKRSSPRAPTVYLLYNGHNHYDALMPYLPQFLNALHTKARNRARNVTYTNHNRTINNTKRMLHASLITNVSTAHNMAGYLNEWIQSRPANAQYWTAIREILLRG